MWLTELMLSSAARLLPAGGFSLKVYSSANGTIEQRLLLGFRVTTKEGRRVKLPAWLGARIAEIHKRALLQGVSTIHDEGAKSALWEYVLEVCSSPPGGLRQRAEASSPVDEVVDVIVESRTQ